MQSLVQYNPDTVYAVRNLYNLAKPEDLNKAIDLLDDWVQKQNHFVKKNFPRSYLERTIIAAKGSIERAKSKIDKMCTLRTLMPEFFGDIDYRNDFKQFNSFISQTLLPKMTEDFYRVYILKNVGKKFEPTLCFEYLKTMFLFADYLMNFDYAAGLIVILDYTEVNMMELMKNITIIELRQGMNILTEGYGFRVKGIHIISPSKLIDVVVKMFKQIFSSKIAGRIHSHKTTDSLRSFLAKDILPIDYGGDERSIANLHDDSINVLSSNEYRQYYKEMNEFRTDESLRRKDVFNEEYIGMPGTFRTLSVD